MTSITLPGHDAKHDYKSTTKWGYGNMPYGASDPYLICSCGFQTSCDTKDFRVARLEHFVDVLSGQWVDERPEYQRLRKKYG
jgi:hypothetical protein